MALLILGCCPSGVSSDFLPAEQAFTYVASAQEDRLLITWMTAPGYYLYRDQLSFATATPGVTLGKPLFPKGIQYEDEFLGSQEIYRDSVTIELPYCLDAGRPPPQMVLKLKWQGCADAGLCYPPTTWSKQLKLPA